MTLPKIRIFLLDQMAILLAIFLAFCIRFNFSFPHAQVLNVIVLAFLTNLIRAAFLYYFAVHCFIARYSRLRYLERLIKGFFVSQILVIGVVLFMKPHAFPRLVLLIEPFISFMFLVSIRLTSRLMREYAYTLHPHK